MAKLLTDRTKEEMLEIEEQVRLDLVGVEYKGNRFNHHFVIIKLINDTPIYELVLQQFNINNVSFEAVDYKSLMLKFRGFIQALK